MSKSVWLKNVVLIAFSFLAIFVACFTVGALKAYAEAPTSETTEMVSESTWEDAEESEPIIFDDAQVFLQAQALNPVLLDDIRLVYTATNGDALKLAPQYVDGSPYFFIPSGVNLSNIALEYDGAPGEAVRAINVADPSIALELTNNVPFDLAAIMGASTNGEYRFILEMSANGVVEQSTTFYLMQSANISSVFVTSADPTNQGRDYVDGSWDKSASAPGSIRVFTEAANDRITGEFTALKGRGNTSWDWTDKKSYQVKLSKKANLLDPSDKDQKAKKWLLIANAFDPTLSRNEFMYALANEIGMEASVEAEPVDFFYDGEYRGTYLLCEKVEIGDGRVEIHDLESDIEKANPDVSDFDSLPTGYGKTAAGCDMRYVEGNISLPANISGGYLLELDDAYYESERSWFKTSSGDVYVIKSPEFCTKEQVLYISSFFEEVLECLYRNGFNSATQKGLYDYIDKESFTKYMYLQELSKNPDGFLSSTYFYKPANEDRLYAGPFWDADTALALKVEQSRFKDPTGYLSGNIAKWFMRTDSFRQGLYEVYMNEIEPIAKQAIYGGSNVPTSMYSIISKKSATSAMNYKLWSFDSLGGTCAPLPTLQQNNDYLLSWSKQRFAWLDSEIKSYSSTYNSSVDYRYAYIYDGDYYAANNPDVVAAFGKGNYAAYFQHFLNYGMSEGRNGISPSRFDVKSYYNLYSDLRNAYGRNLKSYYMHYVQFGHDEGRICTGQSEISSYIRSLNGRDYSPVYDGYFYRASNGDLINAFMWGTDRVKLYDDKSLLQHFVDCGMSEGRRACSTFDLASYYNLYSDLRAAFGRRLESYYLHYLEYGKGERRTCTGVSNLSRYVTWYKGKDYSPIYDGWTYRSSYNDLTGSFMFGTNHVRLYDDIALIAHFVNTGMGEGRNASASFDVVSYYNAHADLRRAFHFDLKSYGMHYLQYGKSERRVCTGVPEIRNYVYTQDGINYMPVYNGATYRIAYWDLDQAFTYNVGKVKLFDDAALLNHFVTFGMSEGRKASTSFDVNVYKDGYWDLRDAFGNDLRRYYLHFIEYGVFEGRKAS